MLANLLDTFVQSGYAGFPHARTVAYLAATVLTLLSVALIAFIFSWMEASLVGLIVPKKASA